MKKTVSSLLAVLLLMTVLFSLTACGGEEESAYVGTWKATQIEASGITMTPEEAQMEFSIDIKSDGTITATTNGESDGEGTWEETDNGISITSGTDVMEATLDDEGNLLFTLYGVTFTMVKE